MEQLYSTEIINNGQEIVLSYGGAAPQEVVLTYEADLPPVMRSREEPAEDSVPPRRRSRKGLYIFLACLVLLAGTVTAAALLPLGQREQGKGDPLEDYGFADYDYGSGEITIEAYPVGEDFRLTLSEERETPLTAQEVYAQVNPSVVSVVAYIGAGGSVGTGVIMSEDGYIVTNHHVIEGATSILVRTRSGDEYSAELIGSDEQSDLAVLKIDASGLIPAVLGDSTKLEVGDLAVVIGNPLGELGGTVTSGIISALDREVSIDGQMMTLMQTDAAVNPGNSGGGLFDANGDLVGIINAKSSGDNVEGLGFAIPISNATDIIDELIANGEVTSRPTLGVSLYDVTDRNTAAQLGVDSTGVYIVQIVQGGSADRAGLQTGDRIISVDGTEVNSTEEVRAALNEHSTGEQMNMEIERDGNTIEVMVSL